MKLSAKFFVVLSSIIFDFIECGMFDTVGYYISSLDGCLVPVQPPDGCSPLAASKAWENDTLALPFSCVNFIALIVRGGNCSFTQKVMNAQNAKFKCAIIYDNKEEQLFHMDGSDDDIDISAFLVTQKCGLTLLNNFTVYNGYQTVITKYTEMDWAKYLIPFVAVFALCFLITLIALIIKLVRDRRKELRRRLSTRKLKKIPTRKYKKNETPETCPICLEDFVEGEKLRVLPCKHWYHTKCVDPWLTKNRKVCPVCKRKVLPDDPDSSDSEGGNEERPSSERRPLLSTNSPETYGSIASFPDGEMASAGEYLSAPSSPESGSPSSSRKETPIVLGFTLVRRECDEESIPSTSGVGIGFNNPSYDNGEENSNSMESSDNQQVNINTPSAPDSSAVNTLIVLTPLKRENIV